MTVGPRGDECGSDGGSDRPSVVERVAEKAVAWSGSTAAFLLAVGVIVVWGVSGPIFQYSDTWQLVINTGTTIVTFLMVFLLQRAQNKDSQAVHLKLNELVAATRGSSNRLISAECLSEKEMALLNKHYKRLVELAVKEESLTNSHSVEEASDRHFEKKKSPTAKRNVKPARKRPVKRKSR
jgi:low affinity Fe/Cu permease